MSIDKNTVIKKSLRIKKRAVRLEAREAHLQRRACEYEYNEHRVEHQNGLRGCFRSEEMLRSVRVGITLLVGGIRRIACIAGNGRL